MSVDAKEAERVRRQSDLLYSGAEISAVYDRLAGEIQSQLGQSEPVVLAVLTGGLIPAGQLLPRLDFLLELDYLHATRYQGGTRGGGLRWITRPSLPLAGRTLLIVDDILDQGLTLAAIQAYCREQGANEVYTAVLVEKKLAQRPVEVQAEFVGVEVEDRYVFGCGMDYHGYHRNLPGIYAVTDAAHKER